MSMERLSHSYQSGIHPDEEGHGKIDAAHEDAATQLQSLSHNELQEAAKEAFPDSEHLQKLSKPKLLEHFKNHLEKRNLNAHKAHDMHYGRGGAFG